MNKKNSKQMSISKIKLIKNISSIIFILCLITLLIFLTKDLIHPIRELIKTDSIDPLKDKFESYGFWGPFFISITQMFVLLLSVLPSEPIQIISIISYGPLLGPLVCFIGIFIGNTLIYIMTKKLGSNAKELYNKKSEKNEDLDFALAKNRASILTLSLYFIPGIPYGLIATTAASTKMKYFRFVIITSLGALPALIYSTVFGSVLIRGNYILSLIIFVLALVLSIFFIINKNKILKKLATKKPKYDMNYFQTRVIKPKFFLYSIVALFARIYFFLKFNVKVKMKGFKRPKGPYVVLYNHPSKFDYVYSFLPLYPTRVNPIIAYYYFCNFKFGKFLHNLGGFPKFLYQADISSVKNIKRVINNGWVFGMAPEGRLSSYGCLETINLPTMKLLKNLNVSVIVANIKGAYLSRPKWAFTNRKGRIEVTFENLFTPEEIQKYSNEEIYNILMDKLNYDDFKWQEEKMIKFKGKRFAEGLEDILYICPVCHNEYTYSSCDDHIHCSSCDTTVKLNNYYQFETDNLNIPKNIRDWYIFQKDFETEQIKDPNYTFSSNVTLKLPDPNGTGFIVVGKGITTLTKTGITYKGTINDEEKEIFFKIENLPAVLYGVREDFEIYHHNTLYYFVPENLRECVKWSVVTELMHEKYINENKIDLIK